jgi:hypothetical protein
MLLRRLSAAIAQRATEATTRKTWAAYKPSRHRARRRRLRLTSDLKPYWGKPAVRNFRGGEGNGMDGLAAICHEAQKGGYIGSRWPTHRRAFSLLDTYSPMTENASPSLATFALVMGMLLCGGCLQHYRNANNDFGAASLLGARYTLLHQATFTVGKSRLLPTLISRKADDDVVLAAGDHVRVTNLVAYSRDLDGSGLLVYAAVEDGQQAGKSVVLGQATGEPRWIVFSDKGGIVVIRVVDDPHPDADDDAEYRGQVCVSLTPWPSPAE